MIQRSNQAVEERTDRLDHQNNQFAENTISLQYIAENKDWQTMLSECTWTTQELLSYLEISDHPLADKTAETLFPLRVPQPFLDKIEKGKPDDPLLLQILPQSAEHNQVDGFLCDPLEEASFNPAPGIVHKYRSRALLITTQSCAIHCRYCFRRNFPYSEYRQSKAEWEKSLDYIDSHKELNEIILSGGDPLALSNSYLSWLLEKIDSFAHIRRIRIHSRLLVCLPQRIDEDCLQLFANLKSKIIIVLHSNHPNELGPDAAEACSKLSALGITLLNQSVVLKNINDDADILAELSETLFNIGVLPYYLFALDKTKGTAHFDMSEADLKALYSEVQTRLPGFLVPKLAQEIPGEKFKRLI